MTEGNKSFKDFQELIDKKKAEIKELDPEYNSN